MYIEDYPPKKEYEYGDHVYCPKRGYSGKVIKVFGKKCNIWLDGIPIRFKQIEMTFKMKDLVLKGHPDYIHNRDSGDQYRKAKGCGKR